MSNVDEKLRRGFELIARSSGDSDLLGVALLAIQGALEDHLRVVLGARPDLSAEDRQLLAARGAGPLTLIELAHKYGELNREERLAVLEAASLRQRFARGEPFDGRVGSVLRYGRFVELLCGRRGLLDQVLIEQRRARARAAAAWESSDAARGAAGVPRTPTQPEPAGIPLGRFMALAALIVVLLCGIWLSTQLDVRRILVALSALPPPTVTSGPTAALPATPAPQRARIVRLGGGPGWLHTDPSFTSGTLPIPLSEGMEVTVLDRTLADADGTTWRYVSVGGYEGWVPANNLAFDG